VPERQNRKPILARWFSLSRCPIVRSLWKRAKVERHNGPLEPQPKHRRDHANENCNPEGKGGRRQDSDDGGNRKSGRKEVPGVSGPQLFGDRSPESQGLTDG
jgi:hypothetical protein